MTTPSVKDSPDRRESRVTKVIEHIKHAIVAGQWKEGDRLPTEFEIAEQIKVSRTPVREAVKVLEMIGVLEVRQGSGTYVRRGVHVALTQLLLFQSQLTNTTPEKLMEIRAVFERTCAELAAQRRTDADLAKMRATIDRLRALAADSTALPEDILEADLAFHRATYHACGNELIATVADFVLSMVAPWIGKSLDRVGPRNAIRLHEIMYAMIESRNAGAARELGSNNNPVEANMQHFLHTITE